MKLQSEILLKFAHKRYYCSCTFYRYKILNEIIRNNKPEVK